MNRKTISENIKEYAFSLGFDACGFAKAEDAKTEKEHVKSWLEKGYHAEMHYLANYFDKRLDPTLLVEGAQSVISVALNYYPQQKQPQTNPQIAYYAYGKDYHNVVKNKLQQLFDYIKTLHPLLEGRMFCDTAPVLERYWAAKAGIGFIGKNSLLIIPGKGSYFFLGEIISNIELEYDTPLNISCGSCNKCQQGCPTQAFEQAYILNSQKCISYQTIENKGDIDISIIPCLDNRLYGCDICQQICPWNRFATPNNIDEFEPSPDFLSLTTEKLELMDEPDYQQIFKHSAIKRAKFSGLKRNLNAIKNTKR
ncbi:tRNA epoxyqueuosine(34) reductase QueG [Dysgonomonas sp. 216]|uniref:tRNA epoxyqueuosine(34) reductase QueG n=1 Tax=Dysgonomonas sp. 216 TaxID=2302934 RepID=UPI0013CF5608|nr:tRNA epoxyqueuosine(34) reductase QueG [Dysgonomonas sp. 216]NDW17629.1 tRNA epoxyqueuosine(34) reductase QueG [Dysgonomonas sp. 216]